MLTDNGGQQAHIPPHELIAAPPQWFTAALNEAGQDHFVPYENTQLHYRAWDCTNPQASARAAAANIVLLHGDGAHARWYDFIAPLLTPYYNVIAADLPGMGDSGWLKAYSRHGMADAIAAMIRHRAFTTPPALIAHSFGGMVGLHVAHAHPASIAALMICDYHVRPPHIHHEWYADVKTPRILRVYATRAEALSRFRLMPEQPCANQFILDYIAEHSIREKEDKGGWTWKFDPAIYVEFLIGTQLPDIYKNLPVPLAAMFGNESHEFDDMSRHDIITYMQGLRPDAPHFSITGARHHIMLDRPHAFAAACSAQMATWRAQGIL